MFSYFIPSKNVHVILFIFVRILIIIGGGAKIEKGSNEGNI
jgi:hypothetical protein